MNEILTILTSVVVPIIVALISSGKIATHVTKKMKLDDLSGKVDELIVTVDDISKQLDNTSSKVDVNQADTYRTRILRFNGEIKRGVRHDEEEFNDCIEAIDRYERYCKKHPEYPNNKCMLAIENVKRVYKKQYETNDFGVNEE